MRHAVAWCVSWTLSSDSSRAARKELLFVVISSLHSALCPCVTLKGLLHSALGICKKMAETRPQHMVLAKVLAVLPLDEAGPGALLCSAAVKCLCLPL